MKRSAQTSGILASWLDERPFCHDLETRPQTDNGTILVTGASGYIGGRLVPELLARGYRVRVMLRAPSKVSEVRWPRVEVAVGDALRPGGLESALAGVDTVYYLIHSLVRGPKEFEEADIRAAANFRDAAAAAKVKRIIYLGGLGSALDRLSLHLKSRLEVAQELRKGPVPMTSLHAAIIIGSGSASFEILLHLVKNLPLILIPRWAKKNRCQPIAVRDVVKYLVGVLERPETSGRAFDIGGRDVITYMEMMRVLARVLEKKRVFIPSPLNAPLLYSYLASLFTPVPAPITLCLMEGLKSDTFCRDDSIRRFLSFEPMGYEESLLRALARREHDRVATRWSDAYPPAHELAPRLHELRRKPRYVASFSLATERSRSALFKAFCGVGGQAGWLHGNWMWRLRGAVDRILFGVGTARGRKSRSTLRIHDVIDFWRVEDLCKDRRLLLRAEMKVPGLAWLEFKADEKEQGSLLSVTAYFDTQGLAGALYWYAFAPMHHYLFNKLLRRIDSLARELEEKTHELSA